MSGKSSEKLPSKEAESSDPVSLRQEVQTTTRPFNPRPFVASLVGQRVNVKLKWGMEYRGKLKCADSYMNVQLENAEEFIEGRTLAQMKMLLIRCNNILYIHKFIPEKVVKEEPEKEAVEQKEQDKKNL